MSRSFNSTPLNPPELSAQLPAAKRSAVGKTRTGAARVDAAPAVADGNQPVVVEAGSQAAPRSVIAEKELAAGRRGAGRTPWGWDQESEFSLAGSDGGEGTDLSQVYSPPSAAAVVDADVVLVAQAAGAASGATGSAVGATTATATGAATGAAATGFGALSATTIALGAAALGGTLLVVNRGSSSSASADTTPPVAPTINAVATDNRINLAEKNGGITITGTQEAGATTTVKINNVERTVQSSGSTWSVSLSKGDIEALGQGEFRIDAVSRDAAGNGSSASSLSFTVDTIVPNFINASASAGAGTVTLAFDSVLDSTQKPVASDFVIKVLGTSNAKLIGAPILIQDKSVVIPVAGLALGEAIEVDYVALSGKLRDAAGNPVGAAGGTSLIVADGYIAGATVYLSRGGVETPIPGAVSDADGRVFIPKGLDLAGGTLVVRGGYNVDTGVRNLMTLKAPAEAKVINPLTTLVQAVAEATAGANPVSAQDVANAAITVAQNLGIAGNLGGASILAFDPIKAASDPTSPDTAVQKAAAKVATLSTIAANADTGNATAAASSVVANLAAEVTKGVVDLGNPNVVNAALKAVPADKRAGTVAAAVSATESISTAATLPAISDSQAKAVDTIAPGQPVIAIASRINNQSDIRVNLDSSKTDGSAVVAGDKVRVFELADGQPVEIASATLERSDVLRGYALLRPSFPLSDGALSLKAQVVDKAGNASALSDTASTTVDLIGPRVQVLTEAVSVGKASTIGIVFSEPVQGFTLDDITPSGGVTGTLSAPRSLDSGGVRYDLSFTPSSSSASLSVGSGYTDVAGNAGSGSGVVTLPIANVAPTVVISSNTPGAASEAVTLTFAFSEPVDGFSESDVKVLQGTGAVLSGSFDGPFENGRVYTVKVKPADNSSADMSVTLDANAVLDAGSPRLGNAATQAFLQKVDTLAPAFQSLVPVSGDAALLSKINAAEYSAGIVLNGTIEPNAVLLVQIGGDLAASRYVQTKQITPPSGSTVQSLPWSFTVTAADIKALEAMAAGDRKVVVAAADLNGNVSSKTIYPISEIDRVAPVVTVSDNKSASLAGRKLGSTDGEVTFTFLFSESVAGFSITDLQVTNGVVKQVNGVNQFTQIGTQSQEYSLVVIPNAGIADGLLSVSVTGGVNGGEFTDLAGNPNSRVPTYSIRMDTLPPSAPEAAFSTFLDNVGPILNAESVASVTDDATPGIIVATGVGETAALYVNGVKVASVFDPANKTLTPAAALSQGDYSIRYSVVDAALNESAFGPARSLKIDTTGPRLTSPVPSTTAAGGGDSVDDTVTLSMVFDSPLYGLTSGTNSTVFTVNNLGVAANWSGVAGETVRTLTYRVAPGQAGQLRIDEAALAVALGSGASDLAGNAFNQGAAIPDIDSTALPVVDGIAPTVSSLGVTSATGAVRGFLNSGDTVTATVTFNENVTVTGSPTLQLTVGTSTVLATYAAVEGANVTFTATIPASSNDADGISIAANSLALSGGAIRDQKGNAAVLQHGLVTDNDRFKVDNAAPMLSEVVLPQTVLSGGANSVGDTVALTVTFNSPVYGLNTGANTSVFKLGNSGVTANWSGEDGSATRVLTYTVAEGQTGQASIDEVALRQAFLASNLQDVAGNAVSVPTAIANIDAQPLPVVDGIVPSVSSVAVSSAINARNNTLNVDDDLIVTVTMTEAVSVTGTPQLALRIGNATVQASYVSSDGAALSFRYRILAGQNDSDGVSILADGLSLPSGATIRDAAGNNAALTHSAVSDNALFKVDTINPGLSASILPSTSLVDGGNSLGDKIVLTLTFDSPIYGLASAESRISNSTVFGQR